MKAIQLSNNKIALVDDNDYDWLNQYTWSCTTNGYAITNRNHRLDKVYMHRLIIPESIEVDHINSNKLDNRRQNLRSVSRQQNVFNKTKHVNNTSGYKGVSWDSSRQKWLAQIMINRRNIHIGRFDNKEEAAQAYNYKATELFGEYARLNKII